MTALLIVLCTVVFSEIEAGAASASTTIYFLAVPNNGPDFNPMFVVRPKTLLIYPDGEWLLDDLKWSGWGSSVAPGTGTSFIHVNEPHLMKITVRSRITLSYPGEIHGHYLYRCYSITSSRVPPGWTATQAFGCFVNVPGAKPPGNSAESLA